MHCYRTAADVGKPTESGTDGSLWFDYIGLQSSGHGPQEPIAITYADKASPSPTGWKTGPPSTRNFITTSTSTLTPPRPSPKANRATSETSRRLDQRIRAEEDPRLLHHPRPQQRDRRRRQILDLVTRGTALDHWAPHRRRQTRSRLRAADRDQVRKIVAGIIGKRRRFRRCFHSPTMPDF